jgi:DNA-directed RNA polymerase specialized sigma24 family protein
MTLLAAPMNRLASGRAALSQPARAVWDGLVRQHARHVVLSLVARGAHPELAREIAQQAWVRIYERHRAGLLPRLEVPGIVIQQAAFLLADSRRRDARLAQSDPREVQAPCFPEPRLIARDVVHRVREVVAKCPGGQQRIFWAIYEDPGASHAEIAEGLGISLQHLRQTLLQVRNRLRAELQEVQ